MKRLFVAMIALTTASPCFAEEIDQLSWLSGCWSLDNADSGSVEMWTPPAGGTMFGIGRTVKSGKTVAHEFMEIRALDSGKLVFIAKPVNQAEATFPLLRRVEGEVVFENLRHDFPQRVSYKLIDRGVLLARIEGSSGGRERAIEYPMRRVECAQ